MKHGNLFLVLQDNRHGPHLRTPAHTLSLLPSVPSLLLSPHPSLSSCGVHLTRCTPGALPGLGGTRPLPPSARTLQGSGRAPGQHRRSGQPLGTWSFRSSSLPLTFHSPDVPTPLHTGHPTEFKAEEPPSVLGVRLSVREVLGTHRGVRKSPLPVTCATPGTTTDTAPKALGTGVAQPEPGGLTDVYAQWPRVSRAVPQAWGPWAWRP